MDKREPTLVPEWYKASSSSSSSSTNSNHHSVSSSHFDEHGSCLSSRKRLSSGSCDRDSLRSLSFTDRSSSSFRQSTSINGSLTNHKDSSHLRPYSSFGRSHRDRDREGDRECDQDRDRSHFLDNGLHDSFESLAVNRNERDALRHSRSMISSKRVDSWPKKLVIESNNNLSRGSSVSGVSKVSFERDFPTLGSEEKQGPSELVRVSSPVLNATINSLPIGTFAKLGPNGWTSALVLPGAARNSGPAVATHVLNNPLNGQSNVLSSSSGLNMAETVAQAPLKLRAEPQLADDTHKKELARRQCAKLVPLTPSAPKALASDKSKAKGTRTVDAIAISKLGQPSSQVVNNVRAPTNPDTPKTSSAGNLQVLNRDKNAVSPTANTTPTDSRAVKAVNGSLKNSVSLGLKVDSKRGVLQSTTNPHEKRLQSQAQNRNEFFNSLRKRSSVNHTEQFLSNGDGLGEATVEATTSVIMVNEIDSLENGLGNGENGGFDVGEISESSIRNHEQCSHANPSIDPEEEAALLQSLGWEESETYEPLTQEEIFSFAEKCKKVVPPPAAQDRICRALRMLNVSDDLPEA